MKIEIDITRNVIEQFQNRFFSEPWNGETHIEMSPDVGVGAMDFVELPSGLELYAYSSEVKEDVELTTTSPPDSPWYGLNINLEGGLKRRVGETELTIHRTRPSGILVHTPGSLVSGINPAGHYSASAFVRFSETFVDQYLHAEREVLRPAHGVVLFEDLDYRSESLLREAIGAMDDPLKAHARLLEFMSLFRQKLAAREREAETADLHQQDLQGLFRAAAALRDPLAEATPSIAALAGEAHMGSTKFKNCFRAVFGTSPHRFHHRVRMDFARDELASGRQSPSELSYALGYSHPSKFTEAFKKFFGQLPSQVHGKQFRP